MATNIIQNHPDLFRIQYAEVLVVAKFKFNSIYIILNAGSNKPTKILKIVQM